MYFVSPPYELSESQACENGQVGRKVKFFFLVHLPHSMNRTAGSSVQCKATHLFHQGKMEVSIARFYTNEQMPFLPAFVVIIMVVSLVCLLLSSSLINEL